MHSSFLLAGALPLVAAELCSSVIIKTHLVTTIATTVEYSTMPAGPSCVVSDVFPSESSSIDNEATPTETTFEWVPTTGDFQWNPIPEPTANLPNEPSPSDISSEDSPEVPTKSNGSPDLPATTRLPGNEQPQEQYTTTFVTTYDMTSTVFTTSVETITSCPPEATDCLAGSTTAVTVTKAISSTVCPVTETITSVGPSETYTESTSSDSEVTATSESELEATTASEGESEATTTSAGEGPEITFTSSADSVSTTTSEGEVESTTYADETSEPSTTAEQTLEPTSTSADETSDASTPASSEEPETSEAPSTFSSIVSTTSALTTETSTTEASTTEAAISTTSKAPEQTNSPRNYPADIVDELQDESMDNLREWLSQNESNGCTIETATVRREWGDLSREQREDYIAAVLCLQDTPGLYADEMTAARSRFDDFVVTHQSQTSWIHNTANFLAWHRYFLHVYEKALKSECGYTGAMPYWNWDRYADDLFNSPMFNGDSASLGGNAGRSGCVEDGPFVDYRVTLGPGPSTRNNERCLARQMSPQAAQYTKVEITYPLITQSNDITTFQDRMQSGNNVHAAGHHTVGGNPGADVYTSPGDPYFHLHHAGVDRLWWIWQLQDLDSRLTAVGGRNGQTRRAGSLTELMNLGKNAGDVELGAVLNTMGGINGELCYVYY